MLNPDERTDFAMRCSQARRWVSRQIDGELAPARVARLNAHLAGCDACRAYADDLAALDLDLLEAPEPGTDFAARLTERLLDQGVPQRRAWMSRPRLFRPLAAGLGLAASLVGFAVGARFGGANEVETRPVTPVDEPVAGGTAELLAADSVESVLLAMLGDSEE